MTRRLSDRDSYSFRYHISMYFTYKAPGTGGHCAACMLVVLLSM